MRWAELVAITAASNLVVCAQAARDFDPHDLSGHWNRTSRFQTFSNVWSGQGPTQGTEEAPFTAAGKARFEKNKPGYGPRAVPPAVGNDPMGTCDPLGIPRLLNTEVISPHQTMEIVQVPGRMIQFFEWHHDWREVFTDGRKLPSADEVDPSWNGTSIGRWDGDVFVVSSIGFDDRTWLDKFGYPHSENMRLEERYRRRDRDTLELTMTLTDPETYTRPWVSDTKVFRIDREKSKRWDEQIYCVPTEEYKFNQRVRDVAGGKESKQ
ncbi:MAG: hypothetical protein LAO55_11680 [Acidobacteriia bacterium]|nr:hypothetical protein [Terriglobia bacterium]